MIEQQGRVITATLLKASVLVGASSGCPACDAGKGCGAGIFGRLLLRKPITLELVNSVQAKAGQAVMVGIPETVFLRLLSRLYLFPLIAALTGAAVGHYLAFRMDSSTAMQDALALLMALILAVLTLPISKARQKWQPQENVVKLLRLAGSPEALNCPQGSAMIRTRAQFDGNQELNTKIHEEVI